MQPPMINVQHEIGRLRRMSRAEERQFWADMNTIISVEVCREINERLNMCDREWVSGDSPTCKFKVIWSFPPNSPEQRYAVGWYTFQ